MKAKRFKVMKGFSIEKFFVRYEKAVAYAEKNGGQVYEEIWVQGVGRKWEKR